MLCKKCEVVSNGNSLSSPSSILSPLPSPSSPLLCLLPSPLPPPPSLPPPSSSASSPPTVEFLEHPQDVTANLGDINIRLHCSVSDGNIFNWEHYLLNGTRWNIVDNRFEELRWDNLILLNMTIFIHRQPSLYMYCICTICSFPEDSPLTPLMVTC